MLEATFYNPEFWKHLSIPFVAGFIGWITNWVAIKLTFKPLEFVGVRPFLGWQGIIPSKATKMAEIFVDKTMYRLGTLDELFRSMEPGKIAEHITKVMDRRLDAYTNEVLFYGHPRVWGVLPQTLKEGVYARVREEMPQLVEALVVDVTESIESLIDFKQMLVTRLEADKQLLNRLFLEAGSEEFRFIVRSGLYFGFLFGLIQLGVWTFYKEWWVLPFFGIVVGYATNWLAINMIFRPLRPIRLGPWTLQGLFLRRQSEVAGVWCGLVTTEIVTLQHIMYEMLHGSRSERAQEMIKGHIRPVADLVMESYGPASRVVVGDETLEEIRESVGEKAVAVSTDPFDHWPFNRERALHAEKLLRERMEGLPPAEFQDLLRPCFQEDELKLILTGAVLGFLAGLAQLVFVFGGFGNG
ncbi:MAG: DUF445 family protein [Acidobacteriota bacterium]|nr:DUF445 family protein [Acidobacteriota bacterium]